MLAGKCRGLASDLDRLLAEVLDEIRPTEEERLEALAIYEGIRRVIEENLRLPYEYTVELHGSVAKGTELRGNIDLDVFILIRYEDISREWLEGEVVRPLLDVLRKTYGGVKLRYAAHPYIHIYLGRHEVDIVPAYWARDVSEIRTPVDRTPFHTRYVVERLTDRARDGVRLLKAFFKSLGIYGAEIKVEGFSGYLTELLVLKYGGFVETLKAMAGWRYGEVVIVNENTGVRDHGYLRRLFRSPLIVPDPVDPTRNAASAVSAESLARAVLASNAFLLNPSRRYLLASATRPPETSVDSACRSIEETGRGVVGLVLKLSGQAAPDVFWGKVKSIGRALLNYLQRSGFSVVSYAAWSDEVSEAVLMVTVLPRELPAYEKHPGPPLGMVRDLRSFVSKYLGGEALGPYVDPDGRVFTLRRRRHTLPHQVVEEYVTSLKGDRNVSAVAVLRDLGELCGYVKSRGDPELVELFRRASKLELV